MLKKYTGLTRSDLNKLALKLGQSFQGKDTVIGLSGELGSGKTTLVKGFGKALGIQRVKSPTFNILSAHKTKAGHFYHLDLYRLNKALDLKPLGIWELLGIPNRIIMIEWINKFPSLKKACDLIIDIKFAGRKRRDLTLRYKK